jgi:hypothetical protein
MNRLNEDKIIEIICTVDDFCKEYSLELSKLPKPDESGRKHPNCLCEMSESKLVTILLLYHFGTFNNLSFG